MLGRILASAAVSSNLQSSLSNVSPEKRDVHVADCPYFTDIFFQKMSGASI